ncbi:RINT1-like protein MAG2L isoform X2 [Zea mays]|uniref:RINT1-like protein MAG2L isoform X2 n=1 Tax=Zea mays TaxID=4577 RepID=UPI0009A9BAE9|nr:RINT1-like protein MAG2L isoform X2 [Zea mays]|eukprot:XP_020404237.1 RINT1-like protein MAG2L isoform X1 [Zea mays]
MPPPPPPSVRGFLDAHFASPDDLAAAPALAELLRRECDGLDASLRRAEARLGAAAASWLARYSEARANLLRVRSRGGRLVAEDDGAEAVRTVGLPALVREIQRIDTIRLYAEATLQLESLVGNLEDAAFSIVRQAPKSKLSSILRKSNETEWKQGKLLHAVDAVKDIERELVRISTSRPQWANLVMAVDSRVDKTLSILRPQALTDYRALLASLGWPPSLSSPDTEKDKYPQIPNPLVLMNEGNKARYSQSFQALCALQHVQGNRESRLCQTAKVTPALADLKYFTRTACFDNGLWAIDELVHPIASRMEYHFVKWSEQPEFIFTLVYKITKDFMDGVDDVLQPLIDQARLVGLSAKESWVTGMVKILVGYLERQIFPALVCSYQDHATVGKPEVDSSWLHLNDVMISFDKRMQLLADSGIQKMTSLSEAQDKLKSEMEDETSWSCSGQHDQRGHMENSTKFLLSTREDYKAPPVCEFVTKTALSMVERGRVLPNRGMQIQYNRSSSVRFLNGFFLVLRERCEALQLSNTALEDHSLSKTSCAINAARYCENVLREWDEDTTFLDMGPQGSLYTDEIGFLVKLGTDHLEQILSWVLLEFEDLSWEYVQSIGSWSGQTILDDEILDEENTGVSPGFVPSLDVLMDRTAKLKRYLNSKDFLDLWRSIAEGLDYYIYSSIRWAEVSFSDPGITQLRVDIKALLHIFRPFCSRPEAFLPFLSESLRLLTMKKSDAQCLLETLMDDTKSDDCLKREGLHHVNASQAAKILSSRKFSG